MDLHRMRKKEDKKRQSVGERGRNRVKRSEKWRYGSSTRKTE